MTGSLASLREDFNKGINPLVNFRGNLKRIMDCHAKSKILLATTSEINAMTD